MNAFEDIAYPLNRRGVIELSSSQVAEQLNLIASARIECMEYVPSRDVLRIYMFSVGRRAYAKSEAYCVSWHELQRPPLAEREDS